MGNSVCTGLEIELDTDSGINELTPLPAGSVLAGKVKIELSKNVEQQPKEPIVVNIHGKEKVSMSLWNAKKIPGDNAYEIPKTTAERNLMSVKLEWPKFPSQGENIIPAGTYHFPFKVQLPKSLPSSTYFPVEKGKQKSKLSFRIQYKMHVTFEKLQAQRYLWIAAAAPYPPPEPVPCMVEPIIHELRGGFFSKGNFVFAASIDDCNIQNSIRLNVSCRNDSPIEIPQIVVTVIEQLRWGTEMVNQVDPQTGICTKSAALSESYKHTVTTLRDIRLPGLVRQSKGLFQTAVDAVMGGPTRRYQQAIHNDLLSGENMILVQVPNIRHSYSGQLIQISHYLRVEFQTSAFSRNPVLEIPIHILGRAEPLPSNQVVTGAGQPYCADLKHKPTIQPVTGLGQSPTSSSTPPHSKGESSDNTVVPLATAVQVSQSDDNINDAPVAIADAVVLLGGDARQSSSTRLQDLVPLAPPTGVVSLGSLLMEMRSSLNEYDLLTNKLDDISWIDLFEALSAEDYGKVISFVSIDMDQPKVALLLASYLKNGLTCEYAAAAIRNASPQHRATLTKKLLKQVKDDDFDLIRIELNEWEQTVTSSAFEAAAKQR